jgi:hypothetical protein
LAYATVTPSSGRQTTRVYAEFHKNVLYAKRADISLALPTSASEDSKTSLASVGWSLRIEFVTGTGEGVVEPGQVGATGFEHYRGVEKAGVEAFDCVVPLRVYASRVGVRGEREFRFAIS